MSLTYAVSGGDVLGKHNAAADTVWYAVLPGKPGRYARLAGFSWTSGNTANSIYAMRPIGRANVATAFTADSGAALVLDADPSASGNTIAAGDQVVVRGADGTYRQHQVTTSGWNGTTKTVTFTANVAVSLAVGAPVFNFGIFTDTNPYTNKAHPLFYTVANTTSTHLFTSAGVTTTEKGDPMLLYCPNATNATVLNWAEFCHSVD